jgi:hypothetical protein
VCIFPFLSTYYYYYDYFYVSGPGADKEDADNARDTINIGICKLKKNQIYLQPDSILCPKFNLGVSWADPRALLRFFHTEAAGNTLALVFFRLVNRKITV